MSLSGEKVAMKKENVVKSPELEQGESSEQSTGFEICDKDNNKWYLDVDVKENDPVQIKKDSTKHHFWEINRSSEEEPSWIFSVTTEKGKLFVTYNSSDNQVKLERGNGSCFTMLMQSEGRVLFRESSSRDRYLVRNKDEILEMLTTQNPTVEMEWMIKYITPPSEGISILAAFSAQILHGTHSKKWLSSGPCANYPIQLVQTSAKQDWTINVLEGAKFQVQSGNYHVNKHLHFGDTAATFTRSLTGSIRCDDHNNDYIYGPESNGDLQLKSNIKYATIWETPTTDITYTVGDKTILLSEIPIKAE